MGAHHRRDDPGAATERPTFDEVARGYDPRQVDDYLATLWRYASQVTSRAAAAEAALRHERERLAAEARTQDNPAQAGNRIGMMLAIAEQEADEIITSARLIAERALEEAIEDAAANHPIVREAREQADKLLLDAVEESRRRAREQHTDLEDQIARSTSSLDTLRHQQGEIIGAMLRLRSLVGADEIDRAFADLAKAGAAPQPTDEPPARRAASSGPASSGPAPSGPQPTHAASRGQSSHSTSSHSTSAYSAPAQPSPPPPPTTPPPNESSTRVRASSASANRVTARTAPRHVHSDVADAEPYATPEPSTEHATAAYRPLSRDDDIIDAEVVEE